jgi:hypothetical protein
MTDRNLLKIGEICRRLAHHGRRFSRGIARAVTEPFRDRLPGRRQVADLCEYQELLADELEARYVQLAAWYDRYLQVLEVVRDLRCQRDHLAAVLRQRLTQVFDALQGSYPPGAIQRFLRRFRPLPASVDELLQLAERFRAALIDPRLELPPPRMGVEVDLMAVAASLEAPARRLGEVLAELPAAEAAVRLSRGQAAGALDQLHSFAGKVAAYYQALSDLAGDEQLARRLWKVVRRGQLSGRSR